MSDLTKEYNSEEPQEDEKPAYEFHLYYRLHILWLLTMISLFLGQAWWLIPLPGDTLLPPYRTYPASVLKSFFEGLTLFLAARSLVVALIKVFTKGIYPDSVVKFRSVGGLEAIRSGIRYRAGFRYLIIASVLPVSLIIGNLLQAELQSSITVFYPLHETISDLDSAQCQHSTPAHYELASQAVSKGLVTHSLADVSSVLENFDKSALSQFGVSLLSSEFTPVSNISFQAPIQSNLVKRHHRPCHDYDDNGGKKKNSHSSNTHSPTVLPSSSASINGTGILVPASNLPAHTTSDAIATPTAVPQESSRIIPSGTHQDANMTSTYRAHQNATSILIDGEHLSNFTGQIDYLDTLPPISTNTTNGTVSFYIFRHTSADHREAIIVLSDPPKYHPAGFYLTAKARNYTCSPQAIPECSERNAVETDANNKVVADALADAMRSNTGLYGNTGLIQDVLQGRFKNDTPLADALFAHPLCSDLDIFPVSAFIARPYTRSTWTILAIIWAVLLIAMWILGAYLIGYTIPVFCHLAQLGHLLPQIISNSVLFVNNDEGRPIEQRMYLDWEQVELLAEETEDEP
ncbi:hypothetical protein BY458DRAFT_523105 [Sporodiniella umbellata]|nr:hypothetical protein BY458DRAFT_523105 [Sporodiniella umbellata]